MRSANKLSTQFNEELAALLLFPERLWLLLLLLLLLLQQHRRVPKASVLDTLAATNRDTHSARWSSSTQGDDAAACKLVISVVMQLSTLLTAPKPSISVDSATPA
jgi:hypothetical protein